MRIVRLSLGLTLAWMCGCGSPPPDFSYTGELRRADGSPAEGVDVVVAPASSIFRGLPHDVKPTTTDSDGHFAGGFANDMDGDDWARLPLSAMPPLPGVFVWVQRGPGWEPIPVSLNTLTQRQQSLGRQQIALPPVVVADNGAGPTTRPADTQR
jgi:hypothetical protein